MNESTNSVTESPGRLLSEEQETAAPDDSATLHSQSTHPPLAPFLHTMPPSPASTATDAAVVGNTHRIRLNVDGFSAATSASRPPRSNRNGQPPPRQRRVRVDRQTGQIQVDIGRGNFVSVPLSRQDIERANNNGSLNLRVITLEPLTPKAILSQGQVLEEDEAWSKFKCAICCEYMQDPVGCTSWNCTGRFCRPCLMRVNQEAREPAKSKCPTCRVEFQHLIYDTALKEEMIKGPEIPCRFQGCERSLKLCDVATHEAQCPHQRLQCRFAAFGCPWTGLRKDLAEHEAHECHPAKVAPFIEDYRKLKADHSAIRSIVQEQTTGALRMIGIHQQNLSREQLKSSASLHDLILYCHVLLCSTPHVFLVKEKWNRFWRSNEGRAGVLNFLVLTPTLLSCAVTGWYGFRSWLIWLDVQADLLKTSNPFLLEDALICITIGLLSLLLCVLNFVDFQSSTNWRKFQIPYLGEHPLVGDLVSLSTFTTLASVLEFHQASVKAFLLWALLVCTTLILPAVVGTVSHHVAHQLATTTVLSLSDPKSVGRAAQPLIFGLRFSFLATFVGIWPFMDAMVANSTLLPLVGNMLSSQLVLRNGFLENAVTSPFAYLYLGGRSAVVAMSLFDHDGESSTTFRFSKEALGAPLKSLLGMALLLLLNFSFYRLFAMGVWLGNKIGEQGQTASQSLLQEHNLLGMVVFAGWACSLAMIGAF